MNLLLANAVTRYEDAVAENTRLADLCRAQQTILEEIAISEEQPNEAYMDESIERVSQAARSAGGYLLSLLKVRSNQGSTAEAVSIVKALILDTQEELLSLCLDSLKLEATEVPIAAVIDVEDRIDQASEELENGGHFLAQKEQREGRRAAHLQKLLQFFKELHSSTEN